MSKSTNPEAVVLGALFDFAGHLRTTDIMNPHAGIDGFAKLRKLSAAEVPTMTWREQLDTLRDPAELLPSDSELVTDLLLLAEAFKDGDPGADNHVFDVLNNAAVRLRQIAGVVADLNLAAETLRRYEVLHRAKGTTESTEKAEVNAALAARFEGTIEKAMGRLVAPGESPTDAELFTFVMTMGFNTEFQEALDPHMEWAKEIEPDNAEEMREQLVRTRATAIEHGLWPLKDGAQ